jgi:hypothetical protein
MKIAICFFGLPRFYKSWKKHFYSFYDGCEIDFYGHFWKSENYNDGELKSEFNFETCIIEPQKKDFIELPKSTDYSKTTKGVFETLSPLYSLKRLGEVISNFEKEYDFIIVTRTDTGCSDNTKFLEFELKEEKFYTSYVNGKEWLVDHLDAKWFCGNQEKLTQLCSTYDRLTKYITDDKIPLCHHRMFFHSMKEYKEDIEMVNVNPSFIHGGWFFNRNEKISST